MHGNVSFVLHAAVQMWELFHTLPFIIGALPGVSLSEPHYACFMLLNDISTILFSPVIAKDQISYVSLLIKQYLKQFTTLYPHRQLTPKCHYMVHVPSLIRR